MTDIAIIGAGTAGLTAAIYARRAGVETVVYEAESYGGQIINTPEIENYPSVRNISGYEFATNLYEQAVSLGAKVEFDSIVSVEGDAASGFTLRGEYEAEQKARAVIIATGAKNRHMGIPFEDKFTGRGVSYCATCDGAFYKGKTAAVFGGGNTAVEDAIYLSALCSKVYIIHRRDEFRADAGLVSRLLSLQNIEPLMSYVVKGLEGQDRLSGLILESTKDGSEKSIDTDALFVAIGQVPSNDVFKDLIALDESGYALAGEDCFSTCEGIFIAGDNRTKKVRQLTTAAADGAVAALAACDFIRSNS
ncbi:MAG: FAD-dependent oxidoreductase [Clostridiales bacterium]|nr:FAD-dependent oxidoreductase [Clostridiales bacterium]